MGRDLDVGIDLIKKQFGTGAIMYFSDKPAAFPSIPTNCLSLDIATGIGGIPRGRITEIYGKEGSGKSTLALHLVAEVQRAGQNAAYVDVEHALDIDYARALDVDVDRLLISQPDDGETAMNITEILMRTSDVTIIIVDSVDALLPKAVIDGDHGDAHVAQLARMMSQSLRKLTPIVSKSNTALVFINQLRHNINTGPFAGEAEFTSGGKALKFYASMRIDMRRIGSVKEGEDDIIGQRVKTKIVKNKLASPMKVVEFDLVFGQGISFLGDLIDLGIACKFVRRSGAWLALEGHGQMGQGRAKSIQWLQDNAEAQTALRSAVRVARGLDESMEAKDDEDE